MNSSIIIQNIQVGNIFLVKMNIYNYILRKLSLSQNIYIDVSIQNIKLALKLSRTETIDSVGSIGFNVKVY